MCVYLRTKFQVSSMILTSFRQGVILHPPTTTTTTSKRTPKKSTQIRVKRRLSQTVFFKNKLYCKQFVPTTTFKSNVTLKIHRIFHQPNCKSSHVLYFFECSKCKVIRNPIRNVRLNNLEKKCYQEKQHISIKPFDIEGHAFKHHAKFIVIEQTQSDKSGQINTSET